MLVGGWGGTGGRTVTLLGNLQAFAGLTTRTSREPPGGRAAVNECYM